MVVNLNGVNFAYDDQGQGSPVLLIHGFPLSRKLWLSQTDYLSQFFRIISIDLRGHGETQSVPGPYSMDMLAEDCHALMNHLHITQPVVLCGLSMGGYIALAFYRKFPSQVAGLILAATRANADSPETRENRDQAIRLANQQGSMAIAESMLPKMFASNTHDANPSLITNVRDIMAHTSVAGITGALHGMKNRPDSYSMLQSIQVPTLIIHGAADQLIPLSVAQGMSAAIPGAILCIIPRTGHLLNLEQPELFNQAVRNFLLKQVQG